MIDMSFDLDFRFRFRFKYTLQDPRLGVPDEFSSSCTLQEYNTFIKDVFYY